jgi:cysteine synthase A
VSTSDISAALPGRRADPWCASVLDAIGGTPLIRVDNIWVKLEFLNPSGSIKARIAKYMIERAEAEGLLQPGDTIVEASSGNTGNAMAMVAAVKGYRMLVVMPDGLSQERAAISRAYGAQVMTLGDFQVTDALAKARELGAQPGYFAPQQFDSEWNVEENRTWLDRRCLLSCPRVSCRTPSSAGWGPAARLSVSGRHFARSIRGAVSSRSNRTSHAR